MAFTCMKRNVFSVLPRVVLVLLSITPLYSSFSSSDRVTKESLDQICSQPTIDKHFCVTWLAPDPTTFTLDLNGLLDLVLQKTDFVGYKNLSEMKYLARTTTDPTHKIPYESCISYYQIAIKGIEEAEGFASSKSYQLASHSVLKAIDSLSVCEAQLKGHDYVPAYVPHFNAMFKRMCVVGTVFSKVLTF